MDRRSANRNWNLSSQIEADLLLSAKKKMPRIQVAGSMVLGIAYLTVPAILIVATLYSFVRHESWGFDLSTDRTAGLAAPRSMKRGWA